MLLRVLSLSVVAAVLFGAKTGPASAQPTYGTSVFNGIDSVGIVGSNAKLTPLPIAIRDHAIEPDSSFSTAPSSSLDAALSYLPNSEELDRHRCHTFRSFVMHPSLPLRLVLPDGGVLRPLPTRDSTATSHPSLVPFYSVVEGSQRDHGIFLINEGKIETIVRGCSGGGCGDPSPDGGRFHNIYSGGSVLPPASNARGDVLFAASTENGPFLYGIYLYLSAERRIIPVIAAGQTVTFNEFSSIVKRFSYGALTDSGEVALVLDTDDQIKKVVTWRNGRFVTRFTEGAVTREGRSIETIYNGFVLTFFERDEILGIPPALAESGVLAAHVVLDNSTDAIVVQSSTVDRPSISIMTGHPAPTGGLIAHLEGGVFVNSVGEIAVLADVLGAPDSWIVGVPGHFRAAVFRGMRIGALSVDQFFWGYSPYRSLDECGNLLFSYSDDIGTTELEGVAVVNTEGVHVLAEETEEWFTFPRWGALNLWNGFNRGGGAVIGGSYLIDPMTSRLDYHRFNATQ